MRFGFFLREALRGLRRSSAPALAALLTVLLTALVLGVFIPIVQATTGTANEVRGRVVVDVYVAPTATQKDTYELGEAIKGTTNVKSVEFISKGEALARAQEKNPEAFREGAELLGANPLPDLVPGDARRPGQARPDRRPPGAGRHARAGRDRRGAQPRGGHRGDPVRHRPREGASPRGSRCCSCSPRSR